MRRLRVCLDREAHARHSGRVDVAQHLLRVDGKTRDLTDLAAAMPIEHPIRLADEAGGGQPSDPLIEAAVRLLVHLERDLPERSALLTAQRAQVLDGQAGLGDDLQHLRKAARLMNRLDEQDLGYLHCALRIRGRRWFIIFRP